MVISRLALIRVTILTLFSPLVVLPTFAQNSEVYSHKQSYDHKQPNLPKVDVATADVLNHNSRSLNLSNPNATKANLPDTDVSNWRILASQSLPDQVLANVLQASLRLQIPVVFAGVIGEDWSQGIYHLQRRIELIVRNYHLKQVPEVLIDPRLFVHLAQAKVPALVKFDFTNTAGIIPIYQQYGNLSWELAQQATIQVTTSQATTSLVSQGQVYEISEPNMIAQAQEKLLAYLQNMPEITLGNALTGVFTQLEESKALLAGQTSLPLMQTSSQISLSYPAQPLSFNLEVWFIDLENVEVRKFFEGLPTAQLQKFFQAPKQVIILSGLSCALLTDQEACLAFWQEKFGKDLQVATPSLIQQFRPTALTRLRGDNQMMNNPHSGSNVRNVRNTHPNGAKVGEASPLQLLIEHFNLQDFAVKVGK
ncbi:TrbC family F-type conjugative pilus assembly protein [Psittacicella hinzii]|nr:TrbC family F-type conjugative pilus assembly protein [Psittacicella hinzii]